MREALRRFAIVETPLSMLVIVPVAIVIVLVSDLPEPMTAHRLALAVIPLTVPFIPLRWHMLEIHWWRPALLWMALTLVPAMALSIALWQLAG